MADPGGWRPAADLPEIAFSGRSNVGKSSLLNRLVRRKALARTSRTPGRTREINFFRVNAQFVIADLPGYGFARISKEAKAKWRPLIEAYLTGSPQLRGVVQLLDIRHDPSRDDLQMLDWLAHIGLPVVVVATKADKLTPTAARARVADLQARVARGILPVSSTTGAGRDDLARAVLALAEQPSGRTA
jgi:GTP-binding protein